MTEEQINEAADGLEYTNGIYGFKQGVKLQKKEQDEFAIGFAEWYLTLTDKERKPFTINKLLEIYKKEKEL